VAWFGTITDFRLENNSWIVRVDYWDDANPTRRIDKTLPSFPLTITKPEVINAIKAKGQEVRGYSTFNTQNIIGQDVPIP